MAIALFVLWGLRPWEDNSADPHEAPLGIEMAVAGGKALPLPSAAGVAAGVAAPRGPRAVVQAAQRATGGAGSTQGPSASPTTVAVVPGRAISVAKAPSSPEGPTPESGGVEEVPSVGATTVEAPPEGTSSPVATPAGAGGGSPKAPVSAGVRPPTLESCEGDEYVITAVLLDEEPTAPTLEEAAAEIVLTRLNEDGSTDELKLEGDLGDARALALTLEAEGSCVTVEIAQPEEEGVEEATEEPGTSEEAPREPRASEEVPGSSEAVAEPVESPVPASP